MATVKLELEDKEYEQLKDIAKKEGFKNLDEFIKFLVKTKISNFQKLPKDFYKGASKKSKVENLDRDKLHDRI